jgi:hypothetical protein
MPSTEGENKVVTFQIGAGGSRVVLTADNGDVRIKKGSITPPTPPAIPMSNVPPYPKTPDLSKTPHLKTPKTPPPAPVTQ